MDELNRRWPHKNRIGVSYPDAPYSRLRHGFRTTADGLIPILEDWSYLLYCLSRVPQLFVQLDQPCGRMTVRIGRKDLLASVDGRVAGSALIPAPNFEGWSRATAKLEACHCCGSPGGVQLYNEFGFQFIQMSAPSDLAPSGWASVLGDIALDRPAQAPVVASASTRDWGRLLCPEDAVEQHCCGVSCFQPLHAAYQMGLPLEVIARRYEVSLLHTYVIERFEREGYWAHCFGTLGGFSLDLYAVKRTVLHDEGGRLAWLLLGDGDAVLYELRAARELAAESAWQQIMQTQLTTGGAKDAY
ncbi:hypothetical protein QEH59_07905 [Coraliomargarita sp. SDUM461004]|uniref:GNAT family N-acetyltransferase n=1 Tax=Thalassobacterium sedimentorum TaxID=3041258 RepID=A0ABU1AHP8_9BACT|nr:hypothetical protein [Coraliomargarita sp. SDUM461004]MDQ8194345.1 hypothetical protein [Coraliomargarita sp. SDUM461004]